jgi:hypothetical protein
VGFAIFIFMAVAIHSLVEYPLWYAFVLMPLAFLIGMVHQEQYGSRELKLPRIFLVSLLGVLLAGVIGTAIDYQRLVTSVRVAERALKTGREISTKKPKFTIYSHIYDSIEARIMPVYAGMPSEKIAFMERVSKRFGYIDILDRTALAYALNGRQDDAVRYLIIISKLNQYFYPRIYQDWQEVATKEPAKFAYVFTHMPKPD